MGCPPKACANSAAVGVGIAREYSSPSASWTLRGLASCAQHSSNISALKTIAKHVAFENCCTGFRRGVALQTIQNMGLLSSMAQRMLQNEGGSRTTVYLKKHCAKHGVSKSCCAENTDNCGIFKSRSTENSHCSDMQENVLSRVMV